MLLNVMEYHWAEQIDEALLLLSRTDIKTVPLAGGTYLLGQRDDSIQAVVDLRDLGLSYITEDAQGIHIGAMTTLQSVAESPILQNFAGGILSQAALASSFSRLIRNSATIGGTLGAGTASQADLLTALAVLDAEILVRSGSKTQVNLSGGVFERTSMAQPSITFKGKQERRIPYASLVTDRRPNELILEVILQRSNCTVSAAFMRVGRTPTDVALLNVAAFASATAGMSVRIGLAFGGVNMDVQRIFVVERRLERLKLPTADAWRERIRSVVQASMIGFQPPSDFRASGDYRRISGANMAYHVMEEAISNALQGDKALSKGNN